jgi:hypothetical protein
MVWFLRARRERRLAALDELRRTRKLIEEDVTAFGEQLSDLHVETLTTELDSDMRFDYQRSLDRYEDAKASLREAATTAAVVDVAGILDDGRFHLACVLARRDGVDLPTRREPCFFNPQHGPAVADVAWTPPGGVERQVPVCRSDERRITGGEDPEVRLVRLGDRYVPWYAARPLEPGSALSGPGAALGGRRAHVFGRATPDTDRSIAEAHVRASSQTTGSPGAGFPGAGGI